MKRGRRRPARFVPFRLLAATARRRSPAALVLALTLAASACFPPVRHRGTRPQRPLDRALLLRPGAPLWSTRAPDSFRVRFETGRGPFVIEAHRAWAPRGVDRFWQLARAGFFDDSRFFRVRAGFIAQFGIPGDPAVAALWHARAIPDDSVRTPQSNARGYVAYAMTGPGTRTTQLFVSLGDNARLDAQGFLPIGRVVRGMNVVQALYTGYGENSGGGMRAGRQDSLFLGGAAWLDRRFPRLDRLIEARVLH